MQCLKSFTRALTILGWKPIDSVDSLITRLVHLIDCTGVTNLKLVTNIHGRHLRGSTSIGNSLAYGVSAQTIVITLSGWSGAWRWWAVY
ncbi:hypothetical protein [Lapidilactobacillus salsurivasis]